MRPRILVSHLSCSSPALKRTTSFLRLPRLLLPFLLFRNSWLKLNGSGLSRSVKPVVSPLPLVHPSFFPLPFFLLFPLPSLTPSHPPPPPLPPLLSSRFAELRRKYVLARRASSSFRREQVARWRGLIRSALLSSLATHGLSYLAFSHHISVGPCFTDVHVLNSSSS